MEETAGDSYPTLYSQYETALKQLTRLKKIEETSCPLSSGNDRAEEQLNDESGDSNVVLLPANMEGALSYTNNNAQNWTLGDMTEK